MSEHDWEANMAANSTAVEDRKQAKIDLEESMHNPPERTQDERHSDGTALVGVECRGCGYEHLPQWRRPYGTQEPVEGFWCPDANTWLSRAEATE